MANGFQDNAQGGISFSSPIFSFGNTQPAVNGGFNFDLPLATIQSFAEGALSFTRDNSTNNKAFLSTVIGNAQTGVNAQATRVDAFQRTAIGTLSSISNRMSDTINYGVKRTTTRASCFITTAICELENKPDDCEELTLLRNFRDTFMMETEERKIEVATYYKLAPEILDAIKKRRDAATILAFLRDEYLRPAVHAIKTGDNVRAHKIYVAMVNAAFLFVEEDFFPEGE